MALIFIYFCVMFMPLFMRPLPMLSLTGFAAIAHRHTRTPMFRPGLARVADFFHPRRTVDMMFNHVQYVFGIAIRTANRNLLFLTRFRHPQPKWQGVGMAHVSWQNIG